MFSWAQISEVSVIFFALLLLRMVAFVFSSAIFGQSAVPASLKILFSLTFTLVIFSTVRNPQLPPTYGEDLVLLSARELVVGLSLGFLTRLFFFAVSMTGDMVSMAMGLSNASLFNPTTNSQGNVIEQLHVVIGTLMLLALGGHHIFIEAIAQSYTLVPVGAWTLKASTLGEFVRLAQDVFIITVKMCAPVIVAMLLTNVGMAILGRAIPQINVLVTSAPIQVLIGLFVLFVCMPLWVLEINGLLDLTATNLFQIMKSL